MNPPPQNWNSSTTDDSSSSNKSTSYILDLINSMDVYNMDSIREEVNALCWESASSILPPLPEDTPSPPGTDGNAQNVEFPTSIELPANCNVPLNMVDRTTVGLNSMTKVVSMICDKRVIKWGIIQRPDKTLALQFLIKRNRRRNNYGAQRNANSFIGNTSMGAVQAPAPVGPMGDFISTFLNGNGANPPPQ